VEEGEEGDEEGREEGVAILAVAAGLLPLLRRQGFSRAELVVQVGGREGGGEGEGMKGG